MDDLFYYGLNRVEELIGDMDKITRVKIRENLRVMQMGYNLQKHAAEREEGFGKFMLKKYKALKKQLKKQRNDQRLTTND
ncbi:MAG: hypothetical protein IKG86_04865 [Paludibacteraceae bacterium]|nr:hypothetical protein [Paludibacteraceae bacterium]